MRPTRAGAAVLALTALTLAAALASGNNLLYLLYSLLLSAVLLSAAALAIGLRDIEAAAVFPDTVFRDAPFRLVVRLRNGGRVPIHGLGVRWGDASRAVPRLGPQESLDVPIPAALPNRGRNRLEGLCIESRFPFGLLVRRVPVTAEALAFPRPREVRSAVELDADLSESGVVRPRKGRGDELYGIREYDASDDSRLINWKLSARTGKLLVNEFAETAGSRVTIRVPASFGEAAERGIVEAASACRHFTDKGTDIRLITPESSVDYGKGLLHLDKLLTALALLGEGRTARPASAPSSSPSKNSRGRGPDALLEPTYVVAAVVFASLFLVEELPRGLLAAAAPALTAGWWLDKRGGPRIPEPIWNAVSLLMLGYVLLFGWRISGITLANTHLVAYLLVNRVLSPKSASSLRQMCLVLFLAFFLVSGQTISLWYFPFFLLFAASAGAWLMTAEGLSAGGGGLPEEARRRPAGPLAAAVAGCLGLTGISFAATPRIEPLHQMSPFVALGLDKRTPKAKFVSGFTENVSLGFFGSIKKSGARVMRVRPLGDAASARAPEPGVRVRGSAFDRFDGRRWSKDRWPFAYDCGRRRHCRAARGRATLLGGSLGVAVPGALPDAGRRGYEITMSPLNTSVLFTVGGLSRAQAPGNAAFFDHTDSLYFGRRYTFGGLRYRVYRSREGDVPLSRLIREDDALLRERFLRLPLVLDPRVAEISRAVTKEATTAGEKAAAIIRYLGDRCSYSTYSEDPDKDLGRFLAEDCNGNCEYFASAAAMLLRAAGVPSRLVTGFYSDEWNEYGKFYDVRQRHAHAWAEAFVDGRWVTVEATPPEGVLSARASAWLSKSRRYLDALRLRWYRDVIGYDKFVQRNTFHRFGLNLRGETAKRWSLRGAWGGAGLLLAAGLFLAARRARSSAADPGYWGRALEMLSRSGMRAAPSMTPREFARLASRTRPALEPLRPLAEIHYRDRYSPSPLRAEERRGAERLLSRIDEAIRSDKLVE